jgi:hypothetical protein
VLKRRGLPERILFRRLPRRHLSEPHAKANAARARVRAAIVQVEADEANE